MDTEPVYYTLAVWRVKEGREDEFVTAWSDVLTAGFRSLERPPIWGKLLRGAGAIAQVAQLCDQITPGMFVEVATG